MHNEIKKLFERVAELTGYPTEGERTTEEERRNGADYYKGEFLIIDFNSFYGGYRLIKVLESTGETDLDGLARKTKKEMTQYLRGLIKGLTFKK